jgi:arsenate reductase (thioredoxin)
LSAGSDPSTLNQYAVKVMGEMGVDISMNQSKSLQDFEGVKFDYVVTVCDGDVCPFFPGGKKYVHKSFDDTNPYNSNYNEKMAVFRRVRDEIQTWIKETF